MLSKNNRLNKELFDELLKKGVVLHSPLFSFRFKDEGTDAFRVAFVVSKKVSPFAVDRNRLKRRGYSAVRAVLKKLSLKKTINGAFFYKKEALNASYKEIESEVSSLLVRSKAL